MSDLEVARHYLLTNSHGELCPAADPRATFEGECECAYGERIREFEAAVRAEVEAQCAGRIVELEEWLEGRQRELDRIDDVIGWKMMSDPEHAGITGRVWGFEERLRLARAEAAEKRVKELLPQPTTEMEALYRNLLSDLRDLRDGLLPPKATRYPDDASVAYNWLTSRLIERLAAIERAAVADIDAAQEVTNGWVPKT